MESLCLLDSDDLTKGDEDNRGHRLHLEDTAAAAEKSRTKRNQDIEGPVAAQFAPVERFLCWRVCPDARDVTLITVNHVCEDGSDHSGMSLVVVALVVYRGIILV